MIGVHYASLTSQGVQHRVFYLDGHPSRYQPRPTGLNFGDQTVTGVFPLVIAVPPSSTSFLLSSALIPLDRKNDVIYGNFYFDPFYRVSSICWTLRSREITNTMLTLVKLLLLSET